MSIEQFIGIPTIILAIFFLSGDLII